MGCLFSASFHKKIDKSLKELISTLPEKFNAKDTDPYKEIILELDILKSALLSGTEESLIKATFQKLKEYAFKNKKNIKEAYLTLYLGYKRGEINEYYLPMIRTEMKNNQNLGSQYNISLLFFQLAKKQQDFYDYRDDVLSRNCIKDASGSTFYPLK